MHHDDLEIKDLGDIAKDLLRSNGASIRLHQTQAWIGQLKAATNWFYQRHSGHAHGGTHQNLPVSPNQKIIVGRPAHSSSRVPEAQSQICWR